MTSAEIVTSLIAFGSFLTGCGTIWMAIITNQTSRNISKRQNVVELHVAWSGIHGIDPDNLVGSHIINAVNAMSLTASLWLHDVTEKKLLYQSYWISYKTLYDTLIKIDKTVPGQNRICKDLLTSDIKAVYNFMEKMEISQVMTTKL